MPLFTLHLLFTSMQDMPHISLAFSRGSPGRSECVPIIPHRRPSIHRYWLLRSLKDPIVATIVGVDYIPRCKMLSPVVVLTLVSVSGLSRSGEGAETGAFPRCRQRVLRSCTPRFPPHLGALRCVDSFHRFRTVISPSASCVRQFCTAVHVARSLGNRRTIVPLLPDAAFRVASFTLLQARGGIPAALKGAERNVPSSRPIGNQL